MTSDSIRENANVIRHLIRLAIVSLGTLEKFLAYVRDIFPFFLTYFLLDFRHRNNTNDRQRSKRVTKHHSLVSNERDVNGRNILRFSFCMQRCTESREAKAASYSASSGSGKIHRAFVTRLRFARRRCRAFFYARIRGRETERCFALPHVAIITRIHGSFVTVGYSRKRISVSLPESLACSN